MRVSVIVPAYNEEASIHQCLAALKDQDYPGGIEIVVVDNNSTDRTAELARSWGARVVHEVKQGYVFAVKRGTEEAAGDILLYTDADTIVPPNWVSSFVAVFDGGPDVFGAGGPVTFQGCNWKGALFCKCILPIALLYDRLCFSSPHLWGANLAVRRNALNKVGGWNTRFNLHADAELSGRLARIGEVRMLRHLRVSTSARRWNAHCFLNASLYAMNFLSLQLLNRPMFFDFPMVRQAPAPLASKSHWARWRAAYATGMFCALLGTFLFFGVWPSSSAYGKVYWRISTPEKLVALTFDDGPNGPSTNAVLRILRDNGIHATFFLIGANVRAYPDMARRIVNEGNAIGNHSYSHPVFLAVQPPREQDRQIDLAEKIIEETTGVHCVLFRPPHGFKSPWLLHAVQSRGMVSVEWAEDSADWTSAKSEKIIANVLNKVRPGDIILLHDGMDLIHGADRRETLQALPLIIKKLKDHGYRFVTIPELIGIPLSTADCSSRAR